MTNLHAKMAGALAAVRMNIRRSHKVRAAYAFSRWSLLLKVDDWRRSEEKKNDRPPG